jgi:hypothetical protein
MNIDRLKEIAGPKEMIGLKSDEVREMARELLALQWQPITPENLPKFGDEAYSTAHGDLLYIHACDLVSYQEWINEGWTHFRPINAPKEVAHL